MASTSAGGRSLPGAAVIGGRPPSLAALVAPLAVPMAVPMAATDDSVRRDHWAEEEGAITGDGVWRAGEVEWAQSGQPSDDRRPLCVSVTAGFSALMVTTRDQRNGWSRLAGPTR